MPVAVERIALVVPAGHRLDGQGPVSLAELNGEPLVGPLPTSSLRPLFDAGFRAVDVEPRVVAEAATHEMMLELVRASVGSTLSLVSGAATVEGRGPDLRCHTDGWMLAGQTRDSDLPRDPGKLRSAYSASGVGSRASGSPISAGIDEMSITRYPDAVPATSRPWPAASA